MKAPKYNDKQKKQIHLSERGNIVSRKECKKGDNDNDQNVYASISSLRTDYLNLDRSSGSGRNNGRVNFFQKNALFVRLITIIQK